MTNKLCLGVALAVAMSLAWTPTAGADVTLGTTTPPSTPTNLNCNAPSVTFIQTGSPGVAYAAPSGGVITQWSFNTTGGTPGDAVNLVVARPTSGGEYTVIAIDPESLPNPLPGGGVATFNLATPIPVNAGDTIAVNSPSPLPTCLWESPSLAPADAFGVYSTIPPSPPAVGQTLQPLVTPSGYLINVSANLVTSLDSSVTTSASPATPSAGNLALLSSTLTNHGPAGGPLTFTDIVPPGLSIASSFASGGSCSVVGQNVTCTTGVVAAGASDTVAVLVVPSAPGTYTNDVMVANLTGLSDPNPANNSASTAIHVTNAPLTGCVVPKKLKGLPASFAKALLVQLGCKVKIKHKHSSSHKGDVISIKPGTGSHPFDTTVTLKVSK